MRKSPRVSTPREPISRLKLVLNPAYLSGSLSSSMISPWLGRRDEVEVLVLDLVHDGLEVLQVRDALVGLPPDHERRLDRCVSPIDEQIEREVDERLVELD
jgi:hypothetical protein